MRNTIVSLSFSKRPKSTGSSRYTRTSIDRPLSSLTIKESTTFLKQHENPVQITATSKNLKVFHQQEFIRLDKELDSWEIQQKNHPICENSCDIYHIYLKNLAFCVKQRDPPLSFRILRGVLGCEKFFKSIEESKEVSIQASYSLKPTRENLTQTHEGVFSSEETYPDTDKDMLFIKNLVKKIEKLRGEKITHKLFELHENLCHIPTDIPTPTVTPEPCDVSLGVIDRKFNIFLKILRNEISKSLRKNNINVLKHDKNSQTAPQSEGIFGDPVKEKVFEIISLKNQIEHMDKEMTLLKENLSKTRNLLQASERKVEESSLELIQITNKYRTSEDFLKNAKPKLILLTDKLARKKLKLKKLKKYIHDREKQYDFYAESLTHAKERTYALDVGYKTLEEKLQQISEAWKNANGQEFSFNNSMPPVEMPSKYSIYKTFESESISTPEVEVAKPSFPFRRRANSMRPEVVSERKYSPKTSPKMPGRGLTSEDFSEVPGNCVKSLIREEFTFAVNTSEEEYGKFLSPQIQQKQTKPKLLSFPTRSIPLTTIIEQSPLPDKNFSSNTLATNSNPANFSDFSKKITENSLPDESSLLPKIPSIDALPELHLSDNTKSLHKRFAVDKIRTTLLKDSTELNSPSFDIYAAEAKTPLLKSLISEQEMIFGTSKKPPDRYLNALENSKEVQCVLLGDPVRSDKRRSTGYKKKSPTEVIRDEQLSDSLKTLSAETGTALFKDQDEVDALPPSIQVEIIRCFEGHDSRRCEDCCVHLKRALAVKSRYRGVPYPIKTLLITPHLE